MIFLGVLARFDIDEMTLAITAYRSFLVALNIVVNLRCNLGTQGWTIPKSDNKSHLDFPLYMGEVSVMQQTKFLSSTRELRNAKIVGQGIHELNPPLRALQPYLDFLCCLRAIGPEA